MDSTDNWEDRMVEIGGIDEFAKWDDGQRAAQDEIREGYEKKFTQIRFGKEIPIGYLAKKFQGKDVNLTKRASRTLGKRAHRLMQKAPYSILAYGYSTTNAYLSEVTGATVSALLPDGKKLFSTLHPASPDNSTTYSNVLSANDVVGETALEKMIVNLDNQLDDRGEKLYLGEGGYIWLVSKDGFFEASRVVGSKLRSGTADNDTNIFNGSFDGRPIEVRWVPWLDRVASTHHVLVSKDAVDEFMPLVMLTSEEFNVDDYEDEPTKVGYVRGQMIFSVGATTGRGIVGSQGTGTGTYTD